MTVLVIAEHDNASIKPATLNTVTAAAQGGGDVHVLSAGHNAGEAAKVMVQKMKVGIQQSAKYAPARARLATAPATNPCWRKPAWNAMCR